MKIPDESLLPNERGKYCGRLNYSLYGTRDAAQNWEREYEATFKSLGFIQGASSPCVFYNPERDIRTVVHGDDFTSIGDDTQLAWLATELKKVYELKLRAVLGPDSYDDKSVRILKPEFPSFPDAS